MVCAGIQANRQGYVPMAAMPSVRRASFEGVEGGGRRGRI